MKAQEGQPPRPYAGAVGKTRTLTTTVWSVDGQTWFGGSYHAAIDVAQSPQLARAFLEGGWSAINRARCPESGWEYVIEEPLVWHDPGHQRLILVIPEGHRHRAQQHRADLLRAVAAEPGGVVPAYALEPVLVVGHEGLAAELAVADRAPEPIEAPQPSSERPTVPSFDIDAIVASPPGERRDSIISTQESVPPPIVGAAVGAIAEAAPAGKSGLLQEVFAVRGALASPPPSPAPPPGGTPAPPPLSPAGAGEDWNASLDSEWAIEEVSPDEEADDPTLMVRLEEAMAPPTPLPAHPPHFDEARAGESGGYVYDDGGSVTAALQVDREAFDRFEQHGLLRIQLHRPEPGPVVTLLLLIDDKAPLKHLWVLDHHAEPHREILTQLEAQFAVEVVFFDEAGERLGSRLFTPPLEENVRAIRAAVVTYEREVGSRLDWQAALAETQRADFNVVGRLRHNFAEDSFSELRSPAKVQLALGILAYWSAPERRSYLVEVKSFPIAWFEGLSRRVLEAAIDFGLAAEPNLRQTMLDLGLAESSEALLQRCLSNFAEVTLNIKPNDLEALDAWDNWEALLAHAEEMDIEVGEEIEELAATVMERAREAALGGEMELGVDDASIEPIEVADLAELTTADLVALLDERDHRLEAALNLLHRADPVYVPPIFDAMKLMGREALLRAVPAALSMGPAFETAFLAGVHSRRASLRLASILFLAEIRSERAVVSLLAILASANEKEWGIVARATARMGRRILPHAIEQVRAEGDDDHRIADTLALLGPEARGAFGAALDKERDRRVRECLERAVERSGQASFGDAADFTERLADAFDAAGPDALGPDFEEQLDSIDIGPGASVDAIVDLDRKV